MAFLFERKNTYGFFGNDLTLKDQFLKEGGLVKKKKANKNKRRRNKNKNKNHQENIQEIDESTQNENSTQVEEKIEEQKVEEPPIESVLESITVKHEEPKSPIETSAEIPASNKKPKQKKNKDKTDGTSKSKEKATAKEFKRSVTLAPKDE